MGDDAGRFPQIRHSVACHGKHYDGVRAVKRQMAVASRYLRAVGIEVYLRQRVHEAPDAGAQEAQHGGPDSPEHRCAVRVLTRPFAHHFEAEGHHGRKRQYLDRREPRAPCLPEGRSAYPVIMVPRAYDAGKEGKPDYHIKPLLSDLAVDSSELDEEEREERGHDKLPHALDPEMHHKPPVILVDGHVVGLVKGEKVEHGKPEETNEEYDRYARPAPSLDHRHYHVEDEHQHYYDYGNLDEKRLFEELPAVVPPEQVSDDSGRAADKEHPELHESQLGAVYLSLHLFGQEVIRRAHETENEPDDKQVYVYHPADVKRYRRKQQIRPEVLGADDQTEKNLGGEQQHGRYEVRIADPL